MSAPRDVPEEFLPSPEDPEVRRRLETRLRELRARERPIAAIAVSLALASFGAAFWAWVRVAFESGLPLGGFALAVGFGWLAGWAPLRVGRVWGLGWTISLVAVALLAMALGDYVGAAQPWGADLGDASSWLGYERVMAWIAHRHPLDVVVSLLLIVAAWAGAHVADPCDAVLHEVRIAVYDARADRADATAWSA